MRLSLIGKETNFLHTHDLGDEVLEYGKLGMNDNEIVFKLWKKEWSEKMGISPEAINKFLKEYWLSTKIRTAIKFMPLVGKSETVIENSLSSEDEQVALKSAIWVQEKLNPDFNEKKGDVTVSNTSITNISINVREESEDLSYLLAEVTDE